jgi:hypothetical protein
MTQEMQTKHPLSGSLTDRTPGQQCGNCRHYEYGPKKLTVGGFRLGRCLYNRPDGPMNQFEDSGGNCPCWQTNAGYPGSETELKALAADVIKLHKPDKPRGEQGDAL